MSHDCYDPAKRAGSPLFHPDGCCCVICGPGGSTINVENNEKGILETMVHGVPHVQAAIRSNHDASKQGIYRTNSVGDND